MFASRRNDSPKLKYPFGYCPPPTIATRNLPENRPALRDIGNRALRRILSDEISSPEKRPTTTPSDRRVYSEPAPKLQNLRPTSPRFLVSPRDLGSRPSFRAAGFSEHFNDDGSVLKKPKHVKTATSTKGDNLLLDCEDASASTMPMSAVQVSKSQPKRMNPSVTIKPRFSQNSTSKPTQIPILRCPPPISTRILPPQTHKTSAGQISILPQTHSLLIDFREGERRSGTSKGQEVLVVSANGENIKVYSAPHLSSPCCLAESLAEYGLGELPGRYHVLYKEASRVVEQLKGKTPRMTMHQQQAKCTLMADEPRGKIELLLDETSPLSPSTQKPSLRFRLTRGTSASIEWILEVTRWVSDDEGCKNTIQKMITFSPPEPGDNEWSGVERKLDPQGGERSGLHALKRFVKVCQAVEELGVGGDLDWTDTLPPAPQSTVSSGTQISFGSVASRRRNLKYPDSHSSTTLEPLEPDGELSTARESSLTHDPQLEFESLLKSTNNVIQTRFKPGVGWCIRTGVGGALGGRYRIMFVDGAVMEVDADEEWVEFREARASQGHDSNETNGGSGVRERMGISECVKDDERLGGKRLKAFAEFVSMFDEDET